jgi:hypothetical protein
MVHERHEKHERKNTSSELLDSCVSRNAGMTMFVSFVPFVDKT